MASRQLSQERFGSTIEEFSCQLIRLEVIQALISGTDGTFDLNLQLPWVCYTQGATHVKGGGPIRASKAAELTRAQTSVYNTSKMKHEQTKKFMGNFKNLLNGNAIF